MSSSSTDALPAAAADLAIPSQQELTEVPNIYRHPCRLFVRTTDLAAWHVARSFGYQATLGAEPVPFYELTPGGVWIRRQA